ncbi:hypothetical protein CBW65_06120 [Tumebacillus avium]|uniref:DUF3800 domain-containing protein n=1 Tax=Tumebacillus avium TaxID=1903704 RepID=A0A1Y0IJQ2_9BACL|nr:DUF3800 domain-containing protein [Tumebacillus avium]ARU60708.1 hypothetical protein CBW65_06120 [Tumebacillus avium]
MLVFVDESGCTGFKFGKGSSRHFVVTMVCFRETLHAETVASLLAKYRETVDWYKEFHFKAIPDKLKHGFLKVIDQGEFYVRAIVIDKEQVGKEFAPGSKKEFYKKVIELLLTDEPVHLENSVIIVDRSSDSAFQDQLKVHMRKTAKKFGVTIKDIKFKDWRQNSLVQVADMISGAVFRKFERGQDDFFKPVAHRTRHLIFVKE